MYQCPAEGHWQSQAQSNDDHYHTVGSATDYVLMIECVWILLQPNVVFVQTIPLVHHLIHNVLFHCKALHTFGGCLSGVSLAHWKKQTQRYSAITKIWVIYVWSVLSTCTFYYTFYLYTIDVFLPSPISLLCNLRESKEVNTIAWACGCLIHCYLWLDQLSRRGKQANSNVSSNHMLMQ